MDRTVEEGNALSNLLNELEEERLWWISLAAKLGEPPPGVYIVRARTEDEVIAKTKELNEQHNLKPDSALILRLLKNDNYDKQWEAMEKAINRLLTMEDLQQLGVGLGSAVINPETRMGYVDKGE